MSQYMLVDGEPQLIENARICANDRGLLLGDGLFETINVSQGTPVSLEAHWARLCDGAGRISLELTINYHQFRQMAHQLIKLNSISFGGLRFTVTRGQGERGLMPVSTDKPSYLLTTFGKPDKAGALKLGLSSISRNASSPLSYIKSLSRMENILVMREAKINGYDDGLMLNTTGEITETSKANFFLIVNDEILTPPIDAGVLSGIMRAKIISYCRANELPLIEKKLTTQHLSAGMSAFISNVIIGVKPVCQIDKLRLNAHRYIDRLQRIFND